MPGVVIVGAQWGDEGKGKVVDLMTEHAEMVVRYGGGPNAGHTLVVGDQKVIVRLIPSGILRKSECVLAQGMVIDPQRLVGEMDELIARGHEQVRSLRVSDRAHIILGYHVLIDSLREQGDGALGTTKRGVGPCYEDKAARRGLLMGDLRNLSAAKIRIERALEAWRPTIEALGGKTPSATDVVRELEPFAARIVPLLCDTQSLVSKALAADKRVLFEGAQGTLLDVDHGTYPFVTSSSAAAGGACMGAGIGPTRIRSVIGLVKAYCTRVGAGPFPTELEDATGERLRKVGDEFGSVTGRPRRTGWLDLCALRYASSVNAFDGIAITKLDVLTGIDPLKICVAYQSAAGRTTDAMPAGLEGIKPVYEEMPGWKEPLGRATTLGDLPEAARKYVQRIEEAAGCSAVLVSVGSRRDETIVRRSVFA